MHTPGPWKVAEFSKGNRTFSGVISDHEHIAYIQPLQDGGPRNAIAQEEQRQANARLIAAAPELLEALQSALACMTIIQVIERGRGDTSASGWDAPIAAAQAAIQKAG